MSQISVLAQYAVRLTAQRGSNVTFVNTSEIDIYYSEEPNVLNAALPSVIPNGTKLAANGGQITFLGFRGELWFKGIANTFVNMDESTAPKPSHQPVEPCDYQPMTFGDRLAAAIRTMRGY